MSLTSEEIKNYKTNLNDFLGRKYVDQSLLLGFNNLLQSKFQAWVIADCNGYYEEMEKLSGPSSSLADTLSVEFKTIRIFEILWSEFHYPIIKFFKLQHAQLYAEFAASVLSDKSKKKSSDKKPLNAVEIRKLNDNFVKFTKQASSYYSVLLKHFATHYKNPLLPSKFLREFNFLISPNSLETTNASLQANLLFLIHRCLLSLGDLDRHKAFLQVSYVNPCLSQKNFWNYRQLTGDNKHSKLMPQYGRSMKSYQSCILLLPALNEPYNHIGMIYNLCGAKFDACYWFLRSQFTRIPNYTLGITNFNTILKKDTFIRALPSIIFGKIDSSRKKRDQLNTVFICLIGYYYLPDQYRQNMGGFINNIKYSKVEAYFFEHLETYFNSSFEGEEESIHNFIKQFVIIISCQKLITEKKVKETDDYNKFLFKYITKILNGYSTVKLNTSSLSNILTFFRLLLNWFKEEKAALRGLSTRTEAMNSLFGLCNNVLGFIFSEQSGSTYLIDKEEFSVPLEQNKRPIRPYYFEEDVAFRDFSLIRFQFKDFNDDQFFTSNQIDLLTGDNSGLFDEDGLFPTFLSKERIDEVRKLSTKIGISRALKKQIKDFENYLRLQACTLLLKKILDSCSSSVSLDMEKLQFVRIKDGVVKNKHKRTDKAKVKSESALPDQSKSRNTKDKEQPKSSISRYNTENRVEPSETLKKDSVSMEDISPNEGVSVPKSIEEINNIILSHSNKLQNDLQKPKTSSHVIDSSASEEVARPTSTYSGSIWSPAPGDSLSLPQTAQHPSDKIDQLEALDESPPLSQRLQQSSDFKMESTISPEVNQNFPYGAPQPDANSSLPQPAFPDFQHPLPPQYSFPFHYPHGGFPIPPMMNASIDSIYSTNQLHSDMVKNMPPMPDQSFVPPYPFVPFPPQNKPVQNKHDGSQSMFNPFN
ncbi:Piso0_001617 [Millerozyma farinosa CBS 7064]|uniref:Piso0_001617 protein n=1 Tax=Pichia sorbitophila (strain ATCC MYA-4447 / BCRC 22081 / CBS 7064 / NBRC 10061 / NRRL Y-12695) TaxID=559304 RepID=G8YNM7_PICSO|nr:Piso0_001617 [Millerozyma farinosa CBS 7064]